MLSEQQKLLPEVSAVAEEINQLPDVAREAVLMVVRNALLLARPTVAKDAGDVATTKRGNSA